MTNSPRKHFIHPQASHFTRDFFFYAYGNTPPTDLLQHVPHDAPRADVLSLGCGDLRDLLYSILLHGRRPRTVSFVLNDYEPAIHARNLVLLQLFLDSRSLLGSDGSTVVDGITAGVEAFDVDGGEHKNREGPPLKGEPAQGTVEAGGAAFAKRIGVIFSAMYNMFVDKDVLATIHDVAGRLAASAATPSEWASTELGKLVQFTDDRSRDRVRKILSSYTDRSLQEKGTFMRIRKERSTFLATYMPKGKTLSFLSRAMGLSSLRLSETVAANDDMRRQYLKEGILDPFPLLRGKAGAPSRGRGRAKQVNPLLLVTERRGTASSLHYGAFPLDAFNTDVSMWKLRPEGLQGEYGKLAPRVTKHGEINSYIGRDGPSATPIPPRVAQDAWLGTALEELGQMCGAFLEATAASQPSNTPPAGARLRIDVHVGDALDVSDALLAVPPAAGGDHHSDAAPSSPIPPVAFQRATIQPLELRKDVFRAGPPAFDVIKTSNLADYLGIVNVVMAASPLLKQHAQALLLTSYLATVQGKHLFEGTAEFYEKLLCMDAHTASVVLGVVPVPSISSVVGHADVTALLTEQSCLPSKNPLGSSMASQLRLAWKRPLQAVVPTTGPTGVLVDISPDDFVRLVLPVYKAMFDHMPKARMLAAARLGQFKLPLDEALRSVTMLKHYTSVSFGRLLVLAGNQIRLGEAHFEAALEATIHKSGLMLAPNLMQEQMAVFHTLSLAPMRHSPGFRSDPLDTRRIVLLVPKSGLLLLRAFRQSELYLALSGKVLPFDNHFVSVHTAFVRVRRGSSHNQDGQHDGWRSLNSHLMVRDTTEDDPEAEFMASALVPTFALMMAPPALTNLELRPRDSPEIFQAPKDVVKKLGGMLTKSFFGADLADINKTAILTPGETDDVGGKGGVAPSRLTCPEEVVASRAKVREHRPTSSKPVRKSSSRPASMHRFMHHGAAVDQSIELVRQAGVRESTGLLYRVTLSMESTQARERLAVGGAPAIEKNRDPCTVRVTLGEGLSHATSFPFPVRRSSIEMKFSKHQGYVLYTVHPMSTGEAMFPFAWTSTDVQGAESRVLPSTPAWSPGPPLVALPRLDFKAEWAHSKVMGGLSFTPAEVAARDERPSTLRNDDNVNQALLGLKETILGVASVACTSHIEERSSCWKRPWICISENGRDDEPAIWVWVNGILLDSSNEGLVLDCCVMPVGRMGEATSTQLGAAIELDKLNGDGAGTVYPKAQPGEMALWDSLLPVAVERARRTYTHTAECTYTTPGGSGRTLLCSCGQGEDLPSDFEESITQVRSPESSVHPLFYRAALSPLFAPAEAFSLQCGKCGKGGKALMKCARCHKVAYCSKDCQRLDWKVHKRTCSA